MLYLKQTAVGMDKWVQSYQQYLYSVLKRVWAVNDQSFDLYGLVFRGQDADGYTPYAYTGLKEYQIVSFDDRKTATGFFVKDDSTKYQDGSASASVSLIFCVNLQLLYPTLDKGADEQARVIAEQVMHRPMYGFSMSGFITGIDNVFKEFTAWRKKEGVKNRDYYPLHCFRINFNLLYNILN